DRRAHVLAVEENRRDAEAAVITADQAYRAEVERAAEAGEVSPLDAELLAKREQLVTEAWPEIHNERKHAAEQLVSDAEAALFAFLGQNADALLDALRGEAEKVAREYIAVRDENAKRLRPLEERSASVRSAVQLVAGNDTRFWPDELPEGVDWHKPQFPFASLEREAREQQEREAAERDDTTLPES